MSCYCPTYVERSFDKVTGECVTKFIGKYQFKEMEQKMLARDYSGNKSQFQFDFDHGRILSNIIQIPCGKCIGCRLDYSRSWADRMTYHILDDKKRSGWFITLTYDDQHMCNELDHSPIYDLYALDYSHISEWFMTRIRNKFRDCSIDFYASGEYGDSSFRPHFHAIVYNAPFDDLVFWKLNDNGDPIYTSDTLDRIWTKGFATISPYSWLGAAYTASYVEKKRDGRMLCEYTAVGLTPEKALMSRRPGIAFDYYNDHRIDIWNNNGLDVDRTVNKSGHLGIPRYFRKLHEKLYLKRSEWTELDFLADEAYNKYKERQINRINILNPMKVDNSSFDLSNVSKMLEFEQRDVISRTVNKKI